VYLILRDEMKWRNVFRLIPGQVTTIGRAPTNRVVVPDDICSRHHCEVFQAGGEWMVRDLDSRNGTLLGAETVDDDSPLSEGDQIQIGEFFLVFTQDISQPSVESEELESDTNTETLDGAAIKAAGLSSPEILHRRQRTRYHGGPEDIGRDRTSQELARLYRLALDMGSAADAAALSEIVLSGLFTAIQVDIGAVLLLPEATKDADSANLRVVAFRASEDQSYEKVSTSLTEIVLEDSEAILARDVKDDARLTDTASLEQLQARSVICAPIRAADSIFGVVHLYTTHGGRTLEVDDLEFTLAVADQFAIALDNLHKRQHLQAGLELARDEADTLRNQLEIESDLVGTSPSMQELQQSIGRIAQTDATVLIRGESGVGKELVSRAIHFSSDRRNGPFVCLNCAALSETLLESELFGHEKGSFTGAVNRKIGKFEQANRGTLFLDEVGEMSLPIQAKFLRVLEGHAFERVGGGTQINVDTRVVAATNRDLEQAIEEKTFRQDLFYRLFVVEIAVAALRDHATDIPILADHFLQRCRAKASCRVTAFSEEAMSALSDYEWPGNVRELQNTVERAVILSRGPLVEVSDIQFSTRTTTTATPITLSSTPAKSSPASGSDNSEGRDVSLERLEREHILATLKRTDWNKSMASQILGIERSTLDRKLKRYNVSRPDRGER
jgi:Nif-specific regulatory protein